MIPAQIQQDGAPPLPQLRSDLDIKAVAERGQGMPSVLVADPVRSTYFRLAWPESGILLHWSEAATVSDLQAILARTYGVNVTPEEIIAVANFAFANQLSEADQRGGWQHYASLREAGHRGLLKTLMHGYLFFRVPLLNPDEALQRLHPRLKFVFSRAFWALIAAIGLVGMFLASRQWSALSAAASDVMRLEGLGVYAAAILILKAIHEFGHALTTVHYGCRVPSMGVAFMLGAPVLYTDTTDSWRLPSRKERLHIVFAGVMAEMVVAAIAIFLWSFLPVGLLRELCFAFATTSIALSLAVNLNPFMRYDGYYALSDWLGVPNLQTRAFAMASWWLREVLFNLRHTAPEQLSTRLRRTITAYAFGTAIYRLSLYLGIVAVVYVVFGKAIGIGLAAFEIIVFIAWPVHSELSAWWGLRSEILARPRALASAGGVALALLAMFTPWIASVEAQAVVVAADEEAIYAPVPARLAVMHVGDGAHVRKGDVVFSAEAPDLQQQLRKAEIDLRLAKLQVARLHASDKERETRVVLESKLARAEEKVAGLERQRQNLVLRAPIDGRIADLDPELAVGQWINPKRLLARVVADTGIKGRSLVPGADVNRIAAGNRATFVADDATSRRLDLTVAAISPASDGRLVEQALADRFGGGVPVSDEHGTLVTRQGWFEVELKGDERARPALSRGVLWIEAERTSPLALVWRQVARVLVREQSF